MQSGSGSGRRVVLRDAVWIGLALGVAVIVMASTAVERQQSAKRKLTIERMLKIRDALARYAVDNAGRLPPSGHLDYLVHRPGPEVKPPPLRWKGPYVKEQDIKDGWGRPFWYLLGAKDKPYQLFSYGRDGKENGDGPDADIEIWDPDTLVP